jgi:hypothetical protein
MPTQEKKRRPQHQAIDTRLLVLVATTFEDDGSFEFVRIAKTPAEAKAFCEGFNRAQMFTEGTAVTADEAIAKAVEDLRGGRSPAGKPKPAPTALPYVPQ